MDRWIADKINKHAAGERLLWAKGSGDGSILILQFDNHSLTLGLDTGGTLVRERQMGPNYQMGERPTEADLMVEDTGIPDRQYPDQILEEAIKSVREATNPFLGHPNDSVTHAQIEQNVQAAIDEAAKCFGYESTLRAKVERDGGGLYIRFINMEDE